MRHLWISILLITSLNISYAKDIKLTKLKVTTAKKVKVPKKIEVNGFQFKLADKYQYKENSLGSSVAYESEEMADFAINMYIYPMDHKVSAEHLMAYEFHALKNQLNQVYENKDFKTALLDEELKLFKAKEVLYSKHTFHNEKGGIISETYLTNLGFHYVKIRMSFPTFQSEKLSLISQDLAQLLIQNTELKENKKSKLQIQITAFDNQALNDVAMKYQLVYALAILNKMSEGDMILSFNDLQEVFEKVILISNNMPKDDEIDTSQFLTLKDIVEAELIDEYIWKSQYQPHWQKPEGLNIEKLDIWFTNQTNKTIVPTTGEQLIKIIYEN